jgi:hypothetical protein
MEFKKALGPASNLSLKNFKNNSKSHQKEK